MNKSNKVLYGLLAVLLYVVLSVGLGLILGLFWKISTECAIIYWVTKGVICAFVLIYALLVLFGAKDKGVGTLQIFMTLGISLLPLVCRALYLIPVAGKYVAITFAFIAFVLYLITMVGMGYYATDINANSDNKSKEI